MILNKKFFFFIILFFLSQIFLNNSYSLEPEEFLKDEKKELRARNISKNVRCLVCQNQSIDISSAPLAKDLRIIIRKKIIEGDTNKEIYNFLSERYGDFILLKPPLKKNTILLWLAPIIFFIVGFFVFMKHYKNSKKLM